MTANANTWTSTATVTLRPARVEDAEQIAPLVSSAADLRQISPDESFPLEPETVRHWIRKREAGYVLVERGRVVAYAELIDDERVRGRAWVGHMMVDLHRRGLGLGRRMVEGLLYVASEERHVREVAISAFADNPRALACYRGCGFEDRQTVRVKDRDLVEMRYLVPARRRTVSFLVAAGAASLAFAATVLWRPSGNLPFDLLVAIPVWSAFVLALWAAYPVIPVRRSRKVVRVLRTTLYPVLIAGAILVAGALVSLVRPVDWRGVAGGLALAVALAIPLLLWRARGILRENDALARSRG